MLGVNASNLYLAKISANQSWIYRGQRGAMPWVVERCSNWYMYRAPRATSQKLKHIRALLLKLPQPNPSWCHWCLLSPHPPRPKFSRSASANNEHTKSWPICRTGYLESLNQTHHVFMRAELSGKIVRLRIDIVLMSCAILSGILSLPSALHLQGASGRQADLNKSRGRKSVTMDQDVSMVKNVEQSLLATCVGSVQELGMSYK